MGVFDVERRTYESRRKELVATAHGKFVLIKGTQMLGLFDTEDEGLVCAYERLGPRAAFFLHRVETVEEEETVHLGVFSARP